MFADVSMRGSGRPIKDWHGDGDCGNTAVTAVIPAVMGTFVAVISREWGWSQGNTVGMVLELAVGYTRGNGDTFSEY